METRTTNLERLNHSPRRVAAAEYPRCHMLRILAFVGLGFCARFAPAQELPPSLREAVSQVQAGDADKAFGVLRRYAFSDNVEQRLASRVALARGDRAAGRLDRALSWVEEYQQPQAENYEWPRIQAYVESAKIQFMRGNAFESIKRMTDAKEKTMGLSKIAVERALSWVVEQKPDLRQALDYEKSALKSGEGYFKREKISDSAGLEPAKVGSDIWNELKPEIEARISDLERKIRIDSYGLDFVLYSEAQEFRKAGHPLSLDFTNVAAAFNQKGEIGGSVPNADYEMATSRYKEILQYFPNNPYGQAAKLYLAVCMAKTGDPDNAIQQLKAFYKEDPDGLYRGEALKMMGDLYLFAKWDKANAREAYERAIRWIEATKERSRVLDTYLVPEKSAAISKPPVTVKMLTPQGETKRIAVPGHALVNRLTSPWYLDALLVESEWRLGFLALIDDDWDQAFKHFDKTLSHDAVLNKAYQENFYNPYDRLKIASKRKVLIGTEEQQKGIEGKKEIVIAWSDFNYLLENFELSMHLYEKIQFHSLDRKEMCVAMRSMLGIFLVKRALQYEISNSYLDSIFNIVIENPNCGSSPYLLELVTLQLGGADHESLKAKDVNELIYKMYPRSDFGIRARYMEILQQVKWENEVMRKEKIDNFKKDYPEKTSYITALETIHKNIPIYLNEIKAMESE